VPVVAFLRSSTRGGFESLETALRSGLKQSGFIEGQNVVIELHYADNDGKQLQQLVAELVRRPVAAIVCNHLAALAAKSASVTVPIVFVTGADPIQDGLVGSLNRPGANVTGVSFLTGVVGSKRLELLHRLVPKAGTIAVLEHRGSPQARADRNDLPPAAQTIGVQLLLIDVENEREFETELAKAVQGGAGALFAGPGGFINSHRDRLVALAARHKLPASFIVREAVVAGGLMSYGPSQSEAYRQAGSYVARILKGEKPGDLPVVQSDKHEFVVNLKTARALGLDIPPALLALVDEVIE
jgi:putative ABC transport system substrate-binding protein